jgi:hypothetical protein
MYIRDMTKTAAPQTANCIRCGRKLTSTSSVAAGMGRTCRAKALAAANVISLAEYKDQTKARENVIDLIELGGLIPQSRDGLYLAVSKSDVKVTYLVDTHEQTCGCKANGRLGYCSHLTGANAIEASRTAA